MTPVTLVMAYYENPSMLDMQFRRLRMLPSDLRDLMHVIIVDDGSPNAAAKPQDIGMPLQIYRVGVDIRWNQDACRNIGAHHAETEWLLLTDMDHVVPEETWRPVVTRRRDPLSVYRFSRVSAPDMLPYKPHPNSWLMTRKMFERVGGYDERFAGLYGTDADIRDRISQSAQIITLKENLIRVPRDVVPDASTTTYLRKQPEDREGLPRLRAERAASADPRPLRLTFPYERVA